MAGIKINELQFQQALEDLEISPVFPTLEGMVHDEFEGLKLYKGFYCQECPKVMGTPGSANVHYSNAHRGIAKPKNLPTGYYQQLRSGRNRNLFRIKPQLRNMISSNEKIVEMLRVETDKAFTEAIGIKELNARSVTPWLLSTKWHLHVNGYDPAELMALVKPLTKRENYKLVDLVYKYFRDAADLIDHTEELILQHLHTPDPAKMYVNFNQSRLTY